MSVVMTRVWSMPNKYTFAVEPLRNIIGRYKQPNEVWLDPFAGQHSPAEITNDLNPDTPAMFHEEAVDFLAGFDGPVDGVIFDPPYSLTQVSRSYKDIGLKFKGKENPTGGFPAARDHIARLVKQGGHVISYGWNSAGMGLKRGFELLEILVCCHGGNHNDTIVVVERKL